MRNLDRSSTEQKEVPSKGSSSFAVPRNAFRGAVATLFLLTGCDISIRPPKAHQDSPVSTPAAAPSPVSPERDQALEKMDLELSRLQGELAVHDAQTASEIAHLREEVKTKVSKEEAEALIHQFLNTPEMLKRMESFRSRMKAVDEHLKKLEENFGYFPRKSEAPWLEFEKKKQAEKRD